MIVLLAQVFATDIVVIREVGPARTFLASGGDRLFAAEEDGGAIMIAQIGDSDLRPGGIDHYFGVVRAGEVLVDDLDGGL